MPSTSAGCTAIQNFVFLLHANVTQFYHTYETWSFHNSPYCRGTDKSLARPHWKNNWKVAIFPPMRRSLLPRRTGWTDNLPNFFFFEWLAKVTLVAVACFLPGRAKDLSASRYFYCLFGTAPYGNCENYRRSEQLAVFYFRIETRKRQRVLSNILFRII